MKNQENILLIGKRFSSIKMEHITKAVELLSEVKTTNEVGAIGLYLGTKYQHLITTNIKYLGEPVNVKTLLAFKNAPSTAQLKKTLYKLSKGKHIDFIANNSGCLDQLNAEKMFFDADWLIDFSIDEFNKRINI